MCRDSLTQNMRKEVEEGVSEKLKERDEGRINQSTDSLTVLPDKTKEQIVEGNDALIVGLLHDLPDETRKQNKFLEENKHNSLILNQIIMVFTGISLFIALASMSLAFLQLKEGQDPSGLAIIILVSSFIIIVTIFFWATIIWDHLKKIGGKHQTMGRIFENLLMIGISIISVIITIDAIKTCPLLGGIILIITIMIICITICQILQEIFG